MVFLHPFDDAAVMAGQGTVALEMLEQVPQLEAVDRSDRWRWVDWRDGGVRSKELNPEDSGDRGADVAKLPSMLAGG